MTKPSFVIDCAHYTDATDEDERGFLTATCACGWICPPCPDEETRTDFLMQHAYEAGILTERVKTAAYSANSGWQNTVHPTATATGP